LSEYIILPGRKLPMRYLNYASSMVLNAGQIVEIPIRTSKEIGLVIQKADEIKPNSSLTQSIKAISEVLPFSLNGMQMNFLFALSNNTMNSPGLLLQNFYQPYKYLTQKRVKSLEESAAEQINSTNLNKIQANSSKIFESVNNQPNVDFIVDLNISVRIMYLIRSMINKNKDQDNVLQSSILSDKDTILVLFPEKKYLNRILQEINLLLKNEFKDVSSFLEFHQFTSDPVKSTKEVVWSLLQSANNKIKIILATRAGLFLPFSHLLAVFLIDEANSLHIQDQNSVYFDTREAVFLLSKSFNADLFFISKLPSIRLHSFYSGSVLQDYMSNIAKSTANGLKLQITQRDSKYDQNSLISSQLIEQLKFELDDDQQMYVSQEI
jgi:primosomal protein N'